MRGKFGTCLVWFVLLAGSVAFFAFWNSGKPQGQEDFYTFLEDVREGRVSEVRVNNNQVTVTAHYPGREYRYTTLGVIDQETTRLLSEQNVAVRPGRESNLFTGNTVLLCAMVIAVIVVVLYLFRRVRGGTGNVFSLTKSKARLISESSEITFQDVGGCAEAKELLRDVIDFLNNPQRWTNAGVRLPRGILLEGPPGCGKTLLARAVAGETKAQFYLVSASEFVEMFVGVGAARIRDMFETAAKTAPSVIFIDELDAVGRRRGHEIHMGHAEYEQTLNQLLVSLDGFQNNERVVVIGATNRPDVLDKALLRPGRFDRRILIPELTRSERIETLGIHTKNKSLADDVSLEALADGTEGFNGAELENLANEAGLLSVRRARLEDSSVSTIRKQDFDQVLESVAGRSREMTKFDTVLTESATRMVEPVGRAIVRLTLLDKTTVEGRIIWVDGSFFKLRFDEDGKELILPKSQVSRIEALESEEPMDVEVLSDDWTG